jgi:membrane peptidoglycan carboxypeptidase
LNSDETQRRVKEEILELYLNYIFMGQNAYGVQAAAQTFFNKDIGNISALEGAILASLPQSPTRYNPYNNPVRVMGDLIIMDRDGVLIANDSVQAAAIERVDALINRIDLSNKQVSSIDKQLVAMMDFTLSVDGQQYNISYQLGRKDYVLMNMLQE